eukprot:313413-Pleurochrysis_carterae.AAC.1
MVRRGSTTHIQPTACQLLGGKHAEARASSWTPFGRSRAWEERAMRAVSQETKPAGTVWCAKLCGARASALGLGRARQANRWSQWQHCTADMAPPPGPASLLVDTTVHKKCDLIAFMCLREAMGLAATLYLYELNLSQALQFRAYCLCVKLRSCKTRQCIRNPEASRCDQRAMVGILNGGTTMSDSRIWLSLKLTYTRVNEQCTAALLPIRDSDAGTGLRALSLKRSAGTS